MTPIYLSTQAEVDAHNERAKVQREAGYKTLMAVSPLVSPGLVQKNLDLDKLFPFAELRPSGFVGGSGRRYQWHDANHAWPSTERPVTVFVSASDRAAASAALTDGLKVWVAAILAATERHGCGFREAVRNHESEIIAEAQAILDREGNK